MTSLNPTITVGKQIGEAVRIHNKKNVERTDQKKSYRTDAAGGIDRPEEGSVSILMNFRGMRQRAVMAIALAGNPKILFADELRLRWM